MSNKRKNAGRICELEFLIGDRSTREGKELYAEFLLAIESRVSIRAAAGLIGVHPSSLTRWIQIGKREVKGVFRQLYDDVIRAASRATAEAEIEVNQQDPKFYLTRGFGRLVTGDLYNQDANPTTQLNVDGSIGAIEDDSLSIDDNQLLPSAGSDDQPQEQTTIGQEETLAALEDLRQQGLDVNDIADRTIAHLRGKDVEDNDRQDESIIDHVEQ